MKMILVTLYHTETTGKGEGSPENGFDPFLCLTRSQISVGFHSPLRPLVPGTNGEYVGPGNRLPKVPRPSKATDPDQKPNDKHLSS